MSHEFNDRLGGIIRQRRTSIPLTLQELATAAGVSASHLARVEYGERFPSAHVLRKIAPILGFEEDELFTLAGYLSAPPGSVSENTVVYSNKKLDPYVAKVLGQEPVEVQRAVVNILTTLKNIAKRDSANASQK